MSKTIVFEFVRFSAPRRLWEQRILPGDYEIEVLYLDYGDLEAQTGMPILDTLHKTIIMNSN